MCVKPKRLRHDLKIETRHWASLSKPAIRTWIAFGLRETWLAFGLRETWLAFGLRETRVSFFCLENSG